MRMVPSNDSEADRSCQGEGVGRVKQGNDETVTDLNKSIRDALRDRDVSACSILVRSSTSGVHEVIAVPVRTGPLTYMISGPDSPVHGLSEDDVMDEILRIGVPVAVVITRRRPVGGRLSDL